MMFCRALVFAWLISALNVAADDRDDVIKKEIAKFQGEWVIAGDESAVLKIKGDEYEFSKPNYLEKGKQTLRPQAKPAEIDVEIKEGDGVGKKQLGIYEIEGDRLKFCFAPAGSKKRPTKFEFSMEDRTVVYRFLKVKK
jgi:uncharacterized protein (TIGR03067 family)